MLPLKFQKTSRDSPSNLATISRPPHPETSQNHLNLQGFAKMPHGPTRRGVDFGNSHQSKRVEEVGWTSGHVEPVDSKGKRLENTNFSGLHLQHLQKKTPKISATSGDPPKKIQKKNTTSVSSGGSSTRLGRFQDMTLGICPPTLDAINLSLAWLGGPRSKI